MKMSSISVDRLESIERNIRRRIEELDRTYKKERALLEKELAEFETAKHSMVPFLIKYGSENVGRNPLPAEGPSADSELPWGRHATGIDHVIYVIEEASSRGLGRLEVLDRIEAISGVKPELNSVTTWLYQAKKRGHITNRRKRWYAISNR